MGSVRSLKRPSPERTARRRMRRERSFARCSLDDLVGAGEDRLWHGEAERFGSIEIDDQLEFDGLLDRQIARISASEDFVDISCGATKQIGAVGPIDH